MEEPTGLERLARLLAATKEDAEAQISKLTSQVQALDVERHTLEAALEQCRDELGDANSMVEQLRLENTRKWRVEERDDWRALVDSVQTDRKILQQENARLEETLKRCIATLRSLFPGSPRVGDAPELTHRTVTIRHDQRHASVDVAWLDSLAHEFGIEDVQDDDPDGLRGGTEKGEGLSEDKPDKKTVEAVTDSGDGGEGASGREAGLARAALEAKVRVQDEELRSLRADVARLQAGSPERDARAAAAPATTNLRIEARASQSETPRGVLGWWRNGNERAGGGGGSGGAGNGRMQGNVTVV